MLETLTNKRKTEVKTSESSLENYSPLKAQNENSLSSRPWPYKELLCLFCLDFLTRVPRFAVAVLGGGCALCVPVFCTGSSQDGGLSCAFHEKDWESLALWGFMSPETRRQEEGVGAVASPLPGSAVLQHCLGPGSLEDITEVWRCCLLQG